MDNTIHRSGNGLKKSDLRQYHHSGRRSKEERSREHITQNEYATVRSSPCGTQAPVISPFRQAAQLYQDQQDGHTSPELGEDNDKRDKFKPAPLKNPFLLVLLVGLFTTVALLGYAARILPEARSDSEQVLPSKMSRENNSKHENSVSSFRPDYSPSSPQAVASPPFITPVVTPVGTETLVVGSVDGLQSDYYGSFGTTTVTETATAIIYPTIKDVITTGMSVITATATPFLITETDSPSNPTATITICPNPPATHTVVYYSKFNMKPCHSVRPGGTLQ
jgi:hypothetical protein